MPDWLPWKRPGLHGIVLVRACPPRLWNRLSTVEFAATDCITIAEAMAQPTHFYNYDCVITDIDRRRYGHRIVPMKVLSLGMDRTGTACILLLPF